MTKVRFRWSGRFTMRQKLILYVLLVLLPVILFSVVYLFQAQRILQDKAGQLMSKSLELSTSWMDETLKGAARLSALVESHYVTRNFLLDHQTVPISEQDVLDITEIQLQLDNILKNEARATSIWIYFPNANEVISTRFGVYKVSDYKALDWLLSQSKDGGIRTWIYPDETVPLHSGTLLDFTQQKESGNRQISFVRSVPGFGTKDMPVIIGVGYLEYTIQDLLSEAAGKTNTSLMLLNDRGYEVLRAGSRIGDEAVPVGTRLGDWEQGQDYAVRRDWLETRSRSALTGWQIVSVAPLSEYMGGLKLLNLLTFALGLSALVVALWLGRSLTRGFHVPLKQLMAQMKKVESGDLSARFRHDAHDEFGKVAGGFNRMVETQDHLIRTVYQERIARQDAELSYLTDQINPHFLYNTLAALYAMAKRVDTTLAQALMAMSKLFRASLNQGNKMITVEATVEQITNYVQLLNIRNPDKYRLELYVDPGAETYRIPSLIVQPIVENAVKHGLELLPKQGVIRISVTLLSVHILIAVSDNGVGMPEARLSRLREFIQDFKASDDDWKGRMIGLSVPEGIEGSGYALKNIFRRLQLKYGRDFVFHIESREDQGTHLTIRIPREDESHEAADRG